MLFLANENFPFPSVKFLREGGYDVKSIAQEFQGISDPEVIRIAQQESRIILTFDKDYGELLFKNTTTKPPAVVFFRFKGLEPVYAGSLLRSVLENQNLALDNCFTVIDENNIRQRKY
jgi:predicted nuclease of predicted toxin-antitoxin system